MECVPAVRNNKFAHNSAKYFRYGFQRGDSESRKKVQVLNQFPEIVTRHHFNSTVRVILTKKIQPVQIFFIQKALLHQEYAPYKKESSAVDMNFG